MPPHAFGTPFIHTYIVKVASRCNINCTYCYVYNKGDQTWRNQPKLMSAETIEILFNRILDHCNAHGEKSVHLVLHGGEPLMGGRKHLSLLTDARTRIFEPAGIIAKISAQTNGILLTPDLCDFLRDHQIGVGISIDGPPSYNDTARVDHQGRGTSARLEEKLQLLQKPEYKPVFGGFLSVVNPDIPPQDFLDYVAQWNPPRLDVLWPNDHHDRLPTGKTAPDDTRYGDWMIALFDAWVKGGYDFEIREFHGLMKLILGGHASSEVHGLTPVDLIVVETNGAIEATDTLKGTCDNATVLGFNIFDHSFDRAVSKVDARLRHEGLEGLSDKCRACPLVSVCGGGHIPHRWNHRNGFNNPSVYCEDLQKLILHIRDHITGELQTLDEKSRPVLRI